VTPEKTARKKWPRQILAVFFRVSHDGLSERGTARGLGNAARINVSRNAFFNSRSEKTIFFDVDCGKINKLTSVFYASVLLLMINCVITLSK